MKRILVLLGRYYPKASPNSICMKNILDLLPKSEFDVEIISYDDGFSAQSDYKISKISRGFIQDKLYKLEDKDDVVSKYIRKILIYASKIKMIPFFITWPWFDPIVTLKELRLAKKIFSNDPYDIVISVYMPLSSLIVAHTIKKTYPSVKYIAYFLDSLSGGGIPSFFSATIQNRKNLFWERLLLSNADKIVFMETSRKYHQSIYKGTIFENKIHYLDLPMMKSYPQKNYDDNDDEITLVYVGSISTSVRSPEYFLKVFSKLPNKRIKMLFVGESDCNLLNEYAKKDYRVKVIGRCSHAEAIEYERKATVLVNLGNSNPNLTPSKVFEYMSMGKKIISTFKCDNDTSIKYLKKYPSILLLDENNTSVDEAADQVIKFLEKEPIEIHFEQLKKKFWQNTPDAFVQMLNEI